MSDDIPCNCKVQRMRARYDVDTDNEQLVADWRNGTSVRSLARSFNEALIDARLESVDRSAVSWSYLPIYEAIMTDELAETDIIEVRRELELGGVDSDDLESDLITHQTMYRHLSSCLEASASPEPSPDERRENARDTVYALQRRTTLVTESTIDTLQSANIIDIGDPDILVDIRIICRDCGQSMDFEATLTGSCGCP